MMRGMLLRYAWLGALALLAGCALRPVNEPIDSRDANAIVRVREKGDSTLRLVLAFSGGGTRAAALAYGVLEELKRTIVPGPPRRRLLDEVDAITGVSGGSFTALSYALYGERLFTEYEPRFLKRDVQGHLVGEFFNPFEWFALASPTYGRSELAAEYYDEILFGKATFGDIVDKPGAPRIIVSATDVTTGTRFTFGPTAFNSICSDLKRFPRSRAAAASSAVPVALSSVTINNYAGRCGPLVSERIRAVTGKEASALAGRPRLRYEEARLLEDSANRPYIHLVDGGVSDNLALRDVIETLAEAEQNAGYRKFLGLENARRLAVIVVNSLSEPATDWDRNEGAPGIVFQLLKASTIPIDRYSYEQIESLNDIVQRWSLLRDRARLEKREHREPAPDEAELPEMTFYPIDIGFTGIEDRDARAYFMNLPTSFTLPAEDVDKLRAIAGELLRANPTYRQLLRDLGVRADTSRGEP